MTKALAETLTEGFALAGWGLGADIMAVRSAGALAEALARVLVQVGVLAGVLDRAWFLPEIRDMVVAENAHSNYSFGLSQQCSLGNIHLDE